MLPAFAESKMFPVPDDRVRLPGPLSVLAKVIGWFAALVLKEPVPEILTGPLNCIAPPAVIELESCVPPDPICVNDPATEPVAPAAKVRSPVFVTFKGPAAKVVNAPLKVKAVPVREIPEAPDVFKAPLKVVDGEGEEPADAD